MLTRYFRKVFFLVLLPSTCFASGQECKNISGMDSLFVQYKKENVLTSLYYRDSSLFKDFETNNINACNLGIELKRIYDTTNLPDNIKERISPQDIHFVNDWCDIEKKILSITPMWSDTDISTFEIVYNMKDAKIIYESFLSSSDQYYRSLSFEQECAFFNHLLKYLTQAEKEKRGELLFEYLTIYDFLSENKASSEE